MMPFNKIQDDGLDGVHSLSAFLVLCISVMFPASVSETGDYLVNLCLTVILAGLLKKLLNFCENFRYFQ